MGFETNLKIETATVYAKYHIEDDTIMTDYQGCIKTTGGLYPCLDEWHVLSNPDEEEIGEDEVEKALYDYHEEVAYG